MNNKNMSRRGFLKASGLTAAGAVALTLSGISVSSNAWSMSLERIDISTGKILSKLCRVLYPHDHLGDMYYDACVEALDGQAKGDKKLLKLLVDGASTLDTTFKTPFLTLSQEQQLEAVKRIEGTPFFNKVRGHVIVALYNNPKVWDSFGYEGPSFPYGGYLERGFNDISWLPKS